MEPCDPKVKAQFDYSRLSNSFSAIAKPAQRALINNGVFTTGDLAKRTRAEVATFHGVGPSVLPKLDAILRGDGLAFRKSR